MARKQTPRQLRADIADDLTDDEDDASDEEPDKEAVTPEDDDSDIDSDASSEEDNSDYDVHDDFTNSGNAAAGSKAKNGKLEAAAGGQGKHKVFY